MATAIQQRTDQAPRRTPPPEPITYEQFLAWADEDTFAEWVDGKVVFMSPVSREHATVSEFLLKITSTFVEVRQLGEVQVKGKARPVVVYELLGLKAGAPVPPR